MPSRYIPSPDALAQSPTREIVEQLQNKLGRTPPNAYMALAALQPNILSALLKADSSATSGGLTLQEKEVIKLQVSAATGCDYCEAAHYMIGKANQISENDLAHIRAARAETGHVRWNVLIKLVAHLMQNKGTIPDELYAQCQAAGLTPAQLAEVAATIAVITFTNIFNRINDTTLDFPAAP